MGKPQCCEKNAVKKGPWSMEEDNILVDYIRKHGHGRWRNLSKDAGLKRCGKSCRLRWTNYLRPDIKRGRFSPEEEDTIMQLHGILGNKWSAIAAQLPGRTDNEIKNFWNTHIKKKLLRMGIDPVTHSPRLDLLNLHSILARYNYPCQCLPCSAPMNDPYTGNFLSYAHFPNEGRLGTASLPKLGNTSACGFPGFCQRATDYAPENNPFEMSFNGCEKAQNYSEPGSSLSLPLSGSSLATTTYIGSRNIRDAEITGGYHDRSSVNYDFSDGLYVNGLM